MDFGALFVLFHPDLASVSRNVGVARSLGARVLLVDNTPEPVVDEGWALRNGCALIHNGNRDGIAGALERGFAWAERQGLEWLLTMDQDSEVARDWLALLLEAVPGLDPKTALVSAEHVTDVRTFGAECVSRPVLTPVRDTMTSGNLVRVASWKEVGGFDRSLFIDQVDHDFCLRLHDAGWDLFELRGAKMPHPLGDVTVHRLFWKKYHQVSNHSAFRRYTITRNRLRMIFRHCLRHPRFAARESLHFWTELLCILLYEKEKARKARMTLLGARDFMLRRWGGPSESVRRALER